MIQFATTKEYTTYFQTVIDQAGRERESLNVYLDKQLKQLDQLIALISSDNFWRVFPKILGIDAKLGLLNELISFEELSTRELIRIIEKDYQDYYKELCGHKMNMPQLMIFTVI